MQNLVVFFSAVCMHAIAGGPKNFLDARSPPPWDVDVATLETCYSAVCVIAPDFVAVGRTVWA